MVKLKSNQECETENKAATGPCLIEGGLQVDARGKVGFVNGFDLKHVDRLYWVLQGEMLLAVVRPDC